MKKKIFLIPGLALALALASCGTTQTTSTTTNNGGQVTPNGGTESNESTDSNAGTTGTTTNVEATNVLNTTEATGLAPIVTLNTIDTSILTTTNTQELTNVETDTTVTGNHYNGVAITTAKKGTINLTLNNATIYQNSEEGKALWNTNKGVTVNLIVPEGTTSYIYNNADDTNALHIKGTLNISGGGKLVVISGTKTAIKCNSKITITDTTLELAGKAYGIAGETVETTNANITVTYAGKDGIRAEVENEGVAEAPTFDETIGYVKLTNTKFTAVVEGDGIQANTTLTLSGGTINISTKGTFVEYTQENIATYGLEDDDFKWSKLGNSYKKIDSDTIGNNYSKYLALVQSSKGLKVGALKYTLETDLETELDVATTAYNLLITNGAVVNLTTTDSASKVDYGDTTINGDSNVTVTSGNKGFAPEHDFVLDGDNTKLTVLESYEAVEATHVYFKGGTAILSASDDGINAASDYSTTEYKNINLEISGGIVSVNANGDGLDSNGTIYFTGGTTLVLGPTNGGNQALDADGKVYFNGGTVLAIGASGMVNTSNYTSTTQDYAFDLLQNSNATSTTITITDSNNNVLISVDVNQTFGELVYSNTNLVMGATYNVIIGNTTTAITLTSNVTTSGNSQGGNMPGGTTPGGNFPGSGGPSRR